MARLGRAADPALPFPSLLTLTVCLFLRFAFLNPQLSGYSITGTMAAVDGSPDCLNGFFSEVGFY